MTARLLITVSALLAAIAASGCREKKPPEPKKPDPAASAAPGVVPGFPVPSMPAPLVFTELRDPGAIGVPAGCTIDGPIRRAPLPKAAAVRFIAPPGAASELLLAVDEDGDGAVDRDAVLDADGRPTRALPWKRIDAPPLIAKSDAGYLELAVEDTGGDNRRAVVWREPGRLEPLADGDRLEAVDAACEGAACTLLLTHASASAGPGATVFTSASSKTTPAWTRTDLSGEEKDFAPFSVVASAEKAAAIALSAPPLFSVWELTAAAAPRSLGRVTSPFGVYDVARGVIPFAIAPGKSIEEPCRIDGFSVRLIGVTGSAADVEGQVPPSQVVTRALASGFVVAWLSPVSCRHDGQSIVRAFLVDPRGAPMSSTMAVSDADGFALSAHGDAVDLWLSRRGDLVWVKARCHAPPDRAPPPSSAESAPPGNSPTAAPPAKPAASFL